MKKLKNKSGLSVFLLTGFYSGYCPVAPGTAGTFVAFLIYVLLYLILGNDVRYVNALMVVLFAVPAVFLGTKGEKIFKEKDPQVIVLDEMLGYWISVFMLPFSWVSAVLAFFLFRIYDIIKPYPANDLQRLPGGLGIMIDDYIAGVYALLSLHIINYFLG